MHAARVGGGISDVGFLWRCALNFCALDFRLLAVVPGNTPGAGRLRIIDFLA
jgi:hypothetical protein